MLVSFPAGGPWLRICRGWQLIEVSSTLTKVLAPANANGHSNFQLFSACPKWSNKGSVFLLLIQEKETLIRRTQEESREKERRRGPLGQIVEKSDFVKQSCCCYSILPNQFDLTRGSNWLRQTTRKATGEKRQNCLLPSVVPSNGF